MNTPILTCSTCGGLYGDGAIAGRLCQCSADKRPAYYYGPCFGKTNTEYEADLTALRAENAALRVCANALVIGVDEYWVTTEEGKNTLEEFYRLTIAKEAKS